MRVFLSSTVPVTYARERLYSTSRHPPATHEVTKNPGRLATPACADKTCLRSIALPLCLFLVWNFLAFARIP